MQVQNNNCNMKDTCEIISKCKETIAEKDIEINKLKDLVVDSKMKLLAFETKFSNISRDYEKFKKDKTKLKENIDFLQSSLVKKEKTINIMETEFIEKEKIIKQLHQQINLSNENASMKCDLREV